MCVSKTNFNYYANLLLNLNLLKITQKIKLDYD